jgi:hypothetical protein
MCSHDGQHLSFFLFAVFEILLFWGSAYFSSPIVRYASRNSQLTTHNQIPEGREQKSENRYFGLNRPAQRAKPYALSPMPFST